MTAGMRSGGILESSLNATASRKPAPLSSDAGELSDCRTPRTLSASQRKDGRSAGALTSLKKVLNDDLMLACSLRARLRPSNAATAAVIRS